MGWRRVAIALLLALGMAWAQPGQAPPEQRPVPVRGGKMTPGGPANVSLTVTLAAQERPYVAGAETLVTVTLRNTAAAGGALVPSPEADCPFVFTVRPAKRSAFEVSHEIYMLTTRPEPPAPREQEMAPLRAGAGLDYAVDLAEMLVTPLEPGDYSVSAAITVGGAVHRSAAVALHVAAPRVGLLAAVGNGNGLQLATAMSDGGTLFQRESESGLPASGYFRARKGVHQPGSLAISTDAEGTQETRWLGWTEGGKAEFLHVWGKAVLRSTNVEVGGDARLTAVGWTFNDRSAMFLAVARSGIALIRFGRGESPQVKPFAVAGATFSDAARVRAGLFRNAAGEVRILVIWPEGGRLLCTILNPADGATPARPLVEGGDSIVAAGIEAVARQGAPIVRVVSVGARGVAHLVRVRPGEPNQTAELPKGSERASHWAVSGGPDAAVAAQEGDRTLLLWRPGHDAWERAASSADGSVSHLQLVQLQEQVWAVWADSHRGVVERQLVP
ncbi:MAG: hypothetical protein JSU00_24670 [Acidobacteria bacterium]|nr:hypothetical protein [Acidobacteriota bacterium]